MTRSVFLSTFLLAAVLSPITLQPYTCGPPPEQARLAVLELRVGSFAGENTIEGFNPNIFSYDVLFPESESVGVLWVKTNHPSTMVDVEYDGLPVQLVGQSVAEVDVPLGSSELAIHVTRQGVPPDAKTYIVRIRRAPVFACTEQGIREAIAHGGGPNYFDCDGPTHVPTSAEIAIVNDVILDGEGNLIADAGGGGGSGGNGAGGGAFMAIEVAPKANGPHRVFYVPEGVTAELIGFTVTGGSTPGDGGGILNEGTFTLTDSTVTGNTADIGGGVRNLDTGTLMVTNSDVSQNTAARFGGGIHNRGEMDVVDSVISNNEAGLGSAGLSNWPETAIMTLTRTTVSGNVTQGGGGGMSNRGAATLEQATISGNQAGSSAGGINNQGTLTMSQVTVSSNSALEEGGGVWNGETGTLTLTDTTVSDNQAAEGGGGILNAGTLTLTDTTVSFNSALHGGGIANREVSMALVGTTVYRNTATGLGGGIYNVAATFTMIDGEVSGNTALSSHGGGILNGAGASANLQNIRVSFNSAFNGGGISNDQLETTMTLIGATVEENTAINDGGGINNGGTLRLVDSVVAMNTADNIGGGIQSFSGSTELISTIVSGNAATNGMGGGIQNSVQATLSLTNSTVSGNSADRGGGISSVGTLTLTDSAVSANTATDAGGGLRNEAGGTLVVNRTTVSSNAAGTWGGGIRNFGFANVIDTTVSNNTAVNGAAGSSNRPSGIMTITGSTVSGNNRGGISNSGILTATNTTISGNQSDSDRGGISNLATGSMTLVSTTVSGNRKVWNAGSLTARNTIIDGDCEAAPLVDSLGGNIEGPGNTCGFGHPADQVDVTPTELALDSLQDNGGPTWTHALLPGSVAIDSASECINAAGYPLLVDQRGAPRPYGPACDSGSFELGAAPLPRDLCINDADRAVYESLNYINGGGIPSTCIDAATAIAADCVFGSAQSSPPIAGCPAEIGALIACYPNCTPEVIEAVNQCIATCIAGVTGLSTECAGCYGGWAGCAAHVCVPECAGGVGLPSCTDCLSASGCTGLFDACTGLPGVTDCSAVPDLCEGVDCNDDDLCTEDICNVTDGSCEHPPTDCDDSNECTVDTCNPAAGCEYTPAADGSACAESNECAVGQCAGGACSLTPVPNGTPCTGGTCEAGVCTWYAQDFELLEQANPDALSDDGWLFHANVLDSSGNLKFSYDFAAPNGIGAISDIVTGEGGLAQGDQQLVVYSDYNCCWETNEGHFNGTDIVVQAFWQGLPIPAGALGKTVVFSFDAKRGNINDPADPLCAAPNVCDSEAGAAANTIDSDNVISNYVMADMTNLSASWERFQIVLPLTDPLLEGQSVQFNFGTRASNFEPSGVFYDNIVVGLEGPSGTGGTGGTGGTSGTSGAAGN